MSHVRETIVGDAAVRGVSGGERKRVTLSEALITRASVIAFDNATRGLDASTALEYARSLRIITDLAERTTIATLYQVSESIFDLFDRVAVVDEGRYARSLRIITDLAERTTIATLYQVSESIFDLFDRVAVVDEGRVIYYGPKNQTRSYFESLGYYTPERQTTSDFCTALVDPDQVQFKEGFETRAPRTAEDRERAWLQSDLYKALLNETQEYESATADADHAQQLGTVTANEKNTGVKPSSPYTVSFWQQTKACMWRQLLIQWSTREDMYLKLFTIVTINLVIGALFFGQSRDSTGVFTRGGVLLFATLLNGWLQLEVAFSAVAGRPMLARHRTFAFHRPAAVSLARAIIDIPFLAVQCLLTTIILYWIANLRADAGAFFYFFLVVFLCAYNLTALYRAIASLVPGFNEAIRFSVMALNVIIMTIGYVIRRPQMNWTIFLNYISGIPYAFEALLVNELVGPIPCNPSQIVPFNEPRDVTYQTCALTGASPGSLDTPSQDYLYTTFRYQSRTRGYNWAVVLGFTILYLIITLVAVEKLDWTAGGGGVTIWARTKEAKRRLAGATTEPARKDDPEAAPVQPSRSNSGEASDETRANSPEQTTGDANVQKKALDKWNDKAIFTWKDINLTLENGRRLLHEVDGWVRPGQMTALLGQSGAGKTTLMTALSQRGAAGHLTGEMLVDGKPIDKAFSKGTGLVLQADMHLATQTVREAIEFSALLRQPAEISRADKLAHAQEVIETLELESLADALIGMPGAGLSIEKRKRVTIGVELAAKPDLLLFLDEPTSGLDSAGAAAIVRLLRRLASEGQAILCTIHQPSALLFESFDNVLLLKPGGEVTFFGQTGDVAGKGSERIRRYFESQGAPECHPAQNVAEYILEVVGGSLGRGVDWGKKWRESDDSKAVRTEIDNIVGERSQRPNKVASRDLREYSAHTYEQIRVLVHRQLRDTWRDFAFTYGLLFSHLLVGLLSGGIFYGLNTSPVDLQNRVFVVFLILLNVPAVVNAIISKFFELRVLFEARESPSKIYAWYSLIAAFLIALTPVALVCAVIYFVPGFFLPYGKQPTYVAGFFFLNTLTVVYFFILFALILVGSCPSPVIAAELVPFLLPILAICNGVIVPRASMPQPFRSFVYYVNPISYYVQAQVSTVMHPLQVVCEREDLAIFNSPPGQDCSTYAGAWAQTAGGYLSNPEATAECGFCQYREGSQFAMTLNADYSFRWQAWGILLGFTFFNLFAVFFGYWWMNVKGYGIGVAASKSVAARAWRSVRKSKK
ncbi:atpase [Ceraceosorus bombacis]|uniref:Atpase n=1 Tax=Ceraceosorus bombacis TaxID=401625 RepID=A0A0P1BQY6_9BASI|nr:atpase [Ceraceosorus bombacis]